MTDSKSGFHTLHVDGGKARGKAAIGVVLKAPLDQVSKQVPAGKDHHVAEYQALIEGLELAKSHGVNRIQVFLDSRLVVTQLKGQARVKAEHLKSLNKEAKQLLKDFRDSKIAWVSRKANREPDSLATKALPPKPRKK